MSVNSNEENKPPPEDAKAGPSPGSSSVPSGRESSRRFASIKPPSSLRDVDIKPISGPRDAQTKQKPAETSTGDGEARGSGDEINSDRSGESQHTNEDDKNLKNKGRAWQATRPASVKPSGSLRGVDIESSPAEREPAKPSPIEPERLIYQKLTAETRSRQRRTAQVHLDILRERLEEIAAAEENSEIVVAGIRHEKGLPAELLASCFSAQAQIYVRSDSHIWSTLNRTGFSDLFDCFVEAAKDVTTEAIFVDRIPYSEKAGDVGKIIDDAEDDRLDDFRARMRNRGFRLFLLVTIDIPVGITSIRDESPAVRCLPWTDLWLAEFARTHSVPVLPLYDEVGDALREAAEWESFKDDDRETRLFNRLQDLANGSYARSVQSAISAIRRAVKEASGPPAEDENEKARQIHQNELADTLGPAERREGVDPIRRIMLTVAAFAGGARVEEYYAICRMLMPDGEAEIDRLPRAKRDEIKNKNIDAGRFRNKRVEVDGWDKIFDIECDVARAKLGIHVREGQTIQLDGRWKMIDLQREIARSYPGLISSIMYTIRDRHLFLQLDENEATLLINIICAIRDACGDGFDDVNFARALTGTDPGEENLPITREEGAKLFPGYELEDVIGLANRIGTGERLARYLAASGNEVDPELEGYLFVLKARYPEATPENVVDKLERWRQDLREESVRRLTRHIMRMRVSSSAASEKRRPIIPSMLEILERMLVMPTYVALLVNMIASVPDVDAPDIGKRLLQEFTQAPGAKISEVFDAIFQRLRRALAWEHAPHLNWFEAFDPIREGRAENDLIRALSVCIWDTAINYDVSWSFIPYSRIKDLRVVPGLFKGYVKSADTDGRTDAVAELTESDQAVVSRLVRGFLAQNPVDWLRSLSALVDRLDDEEGLALNIGGRIRDVVWVIMTGAAEKERSILEERANAIAGDVLKSLTAGLRLGFEDNFLVAAQQIEDAVHSPPERFVRRWLALYGLFWPAMLAHWRFTAFGLDPFEPGSGPDTRFRALLDQLVEAAPQRMHAFRDGFEALEKAALRCAVKAVSVRAHDSAVLYRMKADRLKGLANFFAGKARDLPATI